MGLCQARPGTADCRAEAVSCLGHSYLWPWGAHCLNDVTVGPGQVPPLVRRSASVAAGDLGGHTGQSPSLHVVSSSIACCLCRVTREHTRRAPGLLRDQVRRELLQI